MAEVVLEGVLGHLSSPVGKELGLFLATIKVVHEDVEEKQFSNGLVKIWLQNLKDTTHELKDIMNKYVYEELCLEHEEVKCCLSERVQSSGLSSFHPMHVIFHYKLVRRMKRISEKLDELSEERKKLNWMRWFRREKVWHQTTSLFITEPKVYGREIDNDKIVEFFVNVASHSEDLFVYSIIGLGGLGKTTLAQLIFNYEKAVNHIELRIWVCVSEAISGRACENLDLDPLQRGPQDLFQRKRYFIVLDDVWDNQLQNRMRWNRKSLKTLHAKDVGDDVWNELYWRSFFQDIVTDEFGKVTSFKMHDHAQLVSKEVCCIANWVP
ncbi:hypothetical protein JHK87_006808 [Glycine soja]|nr:hypothetical protein JHK87_006808 [Glycine soja]